MISQSFTQVVRQAGMESVLVALALQDIDVEERCHVSSLACRVEARCVGVAGLKESAFAEAPARQSSLSTALRAKTGGKGIIQSYALAPVLELRFEPCAPRPAGRTAFSSPPPFLLKWRQGITLPLVIRKCARS
jgi:hypothetical protein